jgi:hypothetical protein
MMAADCPADATDRAAETAAVAVIFFLANTNLVA